MSNIEHFKQAFNRVGWFIPPYVPAVYLSLLHRHITNPDGAFDNSHLEQWLALVYSDENLSAMVLHRYAATPFVCEYKSTIGEAIEAHFMQLHHVAVAGLLPVIEGITLKLADDHSVQPSRERAPRFRELAARCKREVTEKDIGDVEQVVTMIDSFMVFTEQHLYANSSGSMSGDRTNRHGILHGAYTDIDYGKPINFYKVIAAVDFLCFLSAIRASVSWLAPDSTMESKRLASHYRLCREVAERRPIARENS
jgi:hypothetical protein